ncbi:hypothetical protein CEXT_638001 [Caerostris extrusa]|uniref:Uncharacterized protein n=1 Tax=Caerostris extrusa TaxID=172846 RepID=A0AAV4RB76_CAEEX|nr:hypothetical protein CEXT_638001 [Caerostris extrusa]
MDENLVIVDENQRQQLDKNIHQKHMNVGIPNFYKGTCSARRRAFGRKPGDRSVSPSQPLGHPSLRRPFSRAEAGGARNSLSPGLEL